MHELSVAQAIADTARDHAGGEPVERVSVRIGHLRQVVPDALQFAWEMLTEGTDLDGCALEIEHVPAVIACPGCGDEHTLDWPVMVCPGCSSSDVTMVSGEEFQLSSIDVGQGVT